MSDKTDAILISHPELFMIKLITSEDASEAFSIIQSVITKMNQNNIDQWDNVYPSKDVIANDLNCGHAYGYYDDNNLCGFIVINEEFPNEYNSVKWICLNDKSLIVHRLSVRADCQGKGIAKLLMHFAEDFGRKNGCFSVRLDAFSENPIALRLYQKLGYTITGTVIFRKGKFYCFEKVL